MSESTAPASELTSQYIHQVAGDLERNVKEQQRLAAEIAVLQQQLAALQQDHTVLVNMQQALGVPAAAPEPSQPAVPSPRAKNTAAPGKRRKPKTATAGQPEPKKRSAQKATTAEPAAETAQPTLAELIRRHVAAEHEPRSVAEIASALAQTYPDRGIQVKVMRTTLENLVAKSHVQRTKQGNSVFYTAADSPEATAATPGEGEPAAMR